MINKEQVIELRNQGKSYREIGKILGCGHSIIGYHCSEEQKEKDNNRTKETQKKWHPFKAKLLRFKHKGKLSTKDIEFKKELEEVILKFSNNPICYLTGDAIDIFKTDSYHFDHIIPTALGGSNNLDNLALATKESNFAKRDIPIDDFITLCKKVLIHNGYNVY